MGSIDTDVIQNKATFQLARAILMHISISLHLLVGVNHIRQLLKVKNEVFVDASLWLMLHII